MEVDEHSSGDGQQETPFFTGPNMALLFLILHLGATISFVGQCSVALIYGWTAWGAALLSGSTAILFIAAVVTAITGNPSRLERKLSRRRWISPVRVRNVWWDYYDQSFYPIPFWDREVWIDALQIAGLPASWRILRPVSIGIWVTAAVSLLPALIVFLNDVG